MLITHLVIYYNNGVRDKGGKIMKKYVLREIVKGGKIIAEETFNSIEELKAYLIKNTDDLIDWINDNVYGPKDHRELPDFTEVETVKDINTILDNYDYGWWKLEVKEEYVGKKPISLIDFINIRKNLWENLEIVEEDMLGGNESLVNWLQEELLTIVYMARKENETK